MTVPHITLMVIINLIFGFNIVMVKVGVSSFSPIFFSALRFLLLALLLMPLLRIHTGQMKLIAVAAITGGAIHFSLMFVGLALSEDVAAVAIGIQLVVPFATILSILFLGETVGWRRWLGIALAFSGIMVMGLDPRVFSYITGLSFVVAAAFAGAAAMLFMKRIQSVPVFALQAWLALISAPLLIVASFLFEQNQWNQLQNAEWEAWSTLVYTALAASLVGHGGFYFLLQRYEMSQVAPMTLLATLFAILFGVTLLGDELTSRMLVGGLLALVGVLLIMLRQASAKITPTGGGSMARKRPV